MKRRLPCDDWVCGVVGVGAEVKLEYLPWKVCGKPASRQRAGFAMCEEHMEMFKPEEPHDS